MTARRGSPFRVVAAALAAVAAAAAVTAAAGTGAAAAAAGWARERAAAILVAEVRDGSHAGDPAADLEAVRDAWSGAVPWERVDAQVAAARPAPPVAAVRFVDAACGAAAGDRPEADRPGTGDLVVYREAGPPPWWRVGMLVSAATVVVRDPASGRLGALPAAALLGRPPRWQGVVPGSVRTCSVAASLLPRGEATTAGPSGRVALADPVEVGANFRWLAEHAPPRATSLGDRVGHLAGLLGRLAGKAVGAVVGAVFGALGSTLGGLGLGGVAAGLWEWLGHGFDGRWLHTGLVVALLVGMAFVGGPAAAVLAAVGVGATFGVTRDLPVVGLAGWLVATVAGFAVSVVTGVDDSDHVTVGSVVLAGAADLVILGRLGRLGAAMAQLGRIPLVGSLVAGMGRGLRGGLAVAGTVGDLAVARPLAWARLVGRWVRPLPLSPAAAGGSSLLAVASDAASWRWRPTSLLTDVAGHLGDLSRGVRRGSDAIWPPADLVERWLAGVDPARRPEVLEAALDGVGGFGELAHLHSGARTVGLLASGQDLPSLAAPGGGEGVGGGDPLQGVNLGPPRWDAPLK